MRRFHGDLLVGGASIRDVDGILDDITDGSDFQQRGSFEVEADQRSQLELERPYLLMLDDGDSIKLVAKDIDRSSDPARLVVQFESIG